MVHKRKAELSFSPVYLRDLAKHIQGESFFGDEIKDLKKEAETKEEDIIVGYYLKKPILESEED